VLHALHSGFCSQPYQGRWLEARIAGCHSCIEAQNSIDTGQDLEMLVDAHAHLDRYDLVGEGALDSALQQIAQHRIFTVSNSMDLASYARNLAIAEKCDLVLPVFGVHPWNAPQYAHRLEELREAIDKSPMLGEIGLDHHFVADASHYPAQRKVLAFLLAAAREQGKIVTLHTKGAEMEVLELLDRYEIHRAIVHWYSGPLNIFRELAARGLYFTIGIEVLHSEHIQTIARETPLERLLTETDNPGGPKEFIGGPGMPELVKEVVAGIAQARKSTAEAIAQTVHANLLRLVRDDPRLAETCARVLEERADGG
jgi:TatD DNase family protein